MVGCIIFHVCIRYGVAATAVALAPSARHEIMAVEKRMMYCMYKKARSSGETVGLGIPCDNNVRPPPPPFLALRWLLENSR